MPEEPWRSSERPLPSGATVQTRDGSRPWRGSFACASIGESTFGPGVGRPRSAVSTGATSRQRLGGTRVP